MRTHSFTAPLRGIIPPVITPLLDRDTLDVEGLERLIEHVLGGDVTGLFILGTSGEGPNLSYKLRHEMIARTCQQVNGRVPVLVGITDSAFMESVHLARSAADAGADAVVLAPPFYIPVSQSDLLDHITHLLPELPLPLFLYNMPALTKVTFEPETVRRAMAHPRIVGLKDSSANMIYFQRLAGLLADRPDWSLLIGPEELLGAAFLAGGHGGICAGANIFPALYVELARAAESNDWNRVRILQAQVMDVSNSLYATAENLGAFIRRIKCALSYLGICSDHVTEPFHRSRAPERSQLEQCVERLRGSIESCFDGNVSGAPVFAQHIAS
ncbi:dihydrodipicolinate synthase family protein [Verrucomicrobiota bacterium sgz303538]